MVFTFTVGATEIERFRRKTGALMHLFEKKNSAVTVIWWWCEKKEDEPEKSNTISL